MKANELRIGNWVKSPHTYNEVQVTLAMFSAAYVHEEADDYTYFYHIQPIPLTEEWLLKFGFTMVCVPSAYGYDCNKYDEISNSIIRGAWNGKSWFALTILNRGAHREIKHVHQLQNLCYALTGQELTINEGV